MNFVNRRKKMTVDKMVDLFEHIIDLYDKFVEKVDKELIEPLASGKDSKVKKNIKKFGKSVSLIQILKNITQTFESLVSARLILDKNYSAEMAPQVDPKEASKILDEKLRSLFKYTPLPKRILEGE